MPNEMVAFARKPTGVHVGNPMLERVALCATSAVISAIATVSVQRWRAKERSNRPKDLQPCKAETQTEPTSPRPESKSNQQPGGEIKLVVQLVEDSGSSAELARQKELAQEQYAADCKQQQDLAQQLLLAEERSSQLHAQLSSTQAIKVKLEKRLAAAQEAASSSARDAAASAAQLAAGAARREQAEREALTYRRRAEAAAAEAEACERECTRVRGQAELAEGAVRQMEGRMRESKAALSDLEDRIEAEQREKQVLGRELRQAMAQLGDAGLLQATRERQHSMQLQEVQGALKASEEGRAKAETELARLRARAAEVQVKVEAASKLMRQMDADLRASRVQAAAAAAEASQLRQAKALAERRLEEAGQRLRRTQGELKSLRDRAEMMEARLRVAGIHMP